MTSARLLNSCEKCPISDATDYMYLFFLISFPSVSVVVLVKSVGPTRFFLSDGEGILKEQNAKKKY